MEIPRHWRLFQQREAFKGTWRINEDGIKEVSLDGNHFVPLKINNENQPEAIESFVVYQSPLTEEKVPVA